MCSTKRPAAARVQPGIYVTTAPQETSYRIALLPNGEIQPKMLSSSRNFIGLLFVCVSAFAGTVPGIKNFDQVDAHVYRGAQPTDEGFQYLAKIGVKTVIDLREADDRSKAERQTVANDGMTYINVPMTGLTPPTGAEIGRILAVLEDGTTGPVFVHCRRGADRTGAVIAAYHIDHDNWDNTHALQDAKAHSMSFFQLPRQSFIKNFHPIVREVKAEAPAPSATAAVAN
jgi:protein-tyrosine phosphatase